MRHGEYHKFGISILAQRAVLGVTDGIEQTWEPRARNFNRRRQIHSYVRTLRGSCPCYHTGGRHTFRWKLLQGPRLRTCEARCPFRLTVMSCDGWKTCIGWRTPVREMCDFLTRFYRFMDEADAREVLA